MTGSKILCLGDLHLGLRPSRLPADADPRATSVAEVWRRAVELALGEQVGLVLLSGDLVDRANRYFEAFGPLEEGLRRLAAAGIETCAVAGNHDFDVLPRLAQVVGGERFHLLGRGGRWERFTWGGEEGRPRLHVDGWSFPGRDVREDPVAAYELEPPAGAEAGAPVLGLVHGDLGQPASANAPLSRARLESAGPAAWVLGHVHKPERIDLAGGRWALYPGSPQPLDWSETGAHGAWLVGLEGDRLGLPRPVPLATVRWELREVDLSGVAARDEVEDRVVRAVREEAEALAVEAGDAAPEELLLRLTLTGRSPLHRELSDLARRLEEGAPIERPLEGGGRARLMEVRVATRPALDLEGLSGGDDAAALIASVLMALDRGPEASAGAGEDGPELDPELDPELLRRIRESVREVYDQRPYLPLGGGRRLAEDELRELLAGRAASLLDALVAGRQERIQAPARGPESEPAPAGDARAEPPGEEGP